MWFLTLTYWVGKQNACRRCFRILVYSFDNQFFRAFASIQKTARSTFGRHRLQFIIAFIVTLFLLALNSRQTYERFWPHVPDIYEEKPTSGPMPPPPKYGRLRQWEDNLPQHNLDLPFPEGRTGRYVRFSNQIAMLGWNNVLNEV